MIYESRKLAEVIVLAMLHYKDTPFGQHATLHHQSWYLTYVVHKVKFSLPSETDTTKGDNITFNTSSLEGKAIADKSGAWRTKTYYTTAAEAISALKTKFGITVSDT